MNVTLPSSSTSHRSTRVNGLSFRLMFVLALLAFVTTGFHQAGATDRFTTIEVSQPAEVLPDTGNNWISLRQGRTVREGDRVRTETDGSLELGVREFSYLELSEESEMTVSALVLADTATDRNSVDLKLQRGRLRNHVDHDRPGTSYRLETPNAVAGVRGTTFVCEVVPQESTRCGVLTGEVDFFSPDNRDDALQLESNQESLIGEDQQAPSPADVLDSESRRNLRQFQRKATSWVSGRTPKPRLTEFSAEHFHAPRSLEESIARDQKVAPRNYVDPSFAKQALDQLIVVRVSHPDFDGSVRINSFFFDQLKPIIRRNGGTISQTHDGYKVTF